MTDQPSHSIRAPVRRLEADKYVLTMLLSFAASVVITRIFLQLTGFPEVGSRESGLHIAHLLWGGLLLFAATLLLLIFANHWIFPLTAILSGVGVGLFIDEVGKFITITNNYFFPAAAPIIYGFFLLTVLVYLQVHRRRQIDTRSELYYALTDLTEAIDQDLDEAEREGIMQRLIQVKNNATFPEQAQLARDLLEFLQSDQLHVVEHRPNALERQINRLKQLEARYVTRPVQRATLIVGAGVFGLAALYDPMSIITIMRQAAAPIVELLQLHLIHSPDEIRWFIVRLMLEAIVGALLLVSTSLLLIKHEQRGISFGTIGMLFYLLTVNLFILYFDQFTYILVTVIAFGFYLGMTRYRQRFLLPRVAPAILQHPSPDVATS